MKKSTLKIHSHFIDKHKHAPFLAQKRQDSITHEIIEEGDEVVFCSVCKSAFMVDSWEYIGRSHCHQSQTLKKVPALRSLSLDRKKIEKRKKVAFYKKHSGGVLMAIFILVGVFGMLTMAINALNAPATSISVQGISITEKHYINNGKKYYQAQNYTEAENYYIKTLNINPSNTEALHLLEQLENEYLLALEEADRFFKSNNYDDAKYWYKKAIKYKPNSAYPTGQLSLIIQAQAEPPNSFIKTENLKVNAQHSILKEYPKEWEEFINKDEKLYFWVENLQKTEVLLSYESGLVELRSLEKREIKEKETQKENPKNSVSSSTNTKSVVQNHKDISPEEMTKLRAEIEKKIKIGKLLNTFKGAKMPQATFIYAELFLKEFDKLDKKTIQKAEEINSNLNYGSIAVISKGNKIYYYTLDKRGARQVNQFSTFHFKKNEKMILSDNGRYFLIQNEDKMLHLYDAITKTLLKSMRTNEHKPFLGNVYFDLENNEIVASTEMGESRWNIGN
ncbi:tetratricopeptide repeat protein [Bernardetia sp. OM2101]|uniref:tetratricopeptide repeat protein n=1 Tax=Bernardetia sp. OM2101 TaxID=3344876 RepID=UPI0035CE8853